MLGHRRVGDVDGSLIPDLYFRFLRGADGSGLTPVLEHEDGNGSRSVVRDRPERTLKCDFCSRAGVRREAVS